MSQDDEPFVQYQLEHVIARQHDGTDDDSNLALACPHCNRHKGPNIASIDPPTTSIVPLFNPRIDIWTDHFENHGHIIVGRTPIGRATVRVLKMNDPLRVELRASLLPPEENPSTA